MQVQSSNAPRRSWIHIDASLSVIMRGVSPHAWGQFSCVGSVLMRGVIRGLMRGLVRELMRGLIRGLIRELTSLMQV